MSQAKQSVLVLSGIQDDDSFNTLKIGFPQLFEQCEVTIARFEDIVIILDGEKSVLAFEGTALNEFDSVVFYGSITKNLRLAYPIARMLDSHPKVITMGAEQFRGADKLSQYVDLTLLKIPIPKTLFSSPSTLSTLVSQQLTEPFILKDILASQGNNNFLTTLAEIDSKTHELSQDRYVAQQFIENEYDLRVLYSQSGEYLAFKRARTAGHVNNISKGASGELVKIIDSKLENYCARIANFYKSDLLGIDVVFDSDHTPYILEVNFQPQLFDGFNPKAKLDYYRGILDK